jgi:hypothetical protein
LACSGCVVPLTKPVVQQKPQAEPKIDFRELAEFARTAALSYDSEANIRAAFPKMDVIIRDLPQSGGRYFVVIDIDRHIQTIAVRGTANETNAWSDVSTVKVPDTELGIDIHLGFKRAADELLVDCRRFLQPNYSTVITGHSLGGAMACVLMMKLITENIPVSQVVTFGQPKVTNEAGANKFSTAPLLRVINDQDIVPQLPPSNLTFDLSGPFEHVGPELTLKPNRTTSYSPVHQPRDFITGNNWRELRSEDLVDHPIANYVERLNALK